MSFLCNNNKSEVNNMGTKEVTQSQSTKTGSTGVTNWAGDAKPKGGLSTTKKLTELLADFSI